jgi:hypothetical protein
MWIARDKLEEFREVKWENEEPKELVLKQYGN